MEESHTKGPEHAGSMMAQELAYTGVSARLLWMGKVSGLPRVLLYHFHLVGSRPGTH